MKKICVVTGTRAEYGLLKHLMRGIQNSKKIRAADYCHRHAFI